MLSLLGLQKALVCSACALQSKKALESDWRPKAASLSNCKVETGGFSRVISSIFNDCTDLAFFISANALLLALFNLDVDELVTFMVGSVKSWSCEWSLWTCVMLLWLAIFLFSSKTGFLHLGLRVSSCFLFRSSEEPDFLSSMSRAMLWKSVTLRRPRFSASFCSLSPCSVSVFTWAHKKRQWARKGFSCLNTCPHFPHE